MRNTSKKKKINKKTFGSLIKRFYLYIMKTIKVVIEVDITSNKTFDEIKAGLTRGIYRGLDTEPHNIAQPSNVDIKYIHIK